MFEEALQKAPREELVEHIRLQRELIQRLHRRVIELEAALERACVTSKNTREDVDGPSSNSPVRDVTTAVILKEPRQAQAASKNGRTSAAITAPAAPGSPRARKPAWSSSTSLSKSRSSSASPLPTEKRIVSATSKGSANPHAEHTSTAAAPEPRREPPTPHVERHLDAVAPRQQHQQQPSMAVVPAPPMGAAASTNALMKSLSSSSTLSSPSADHPTVLEGIKEINYVLAAHRAGRPALPLPVVEELEEIRGRLLQGFKQIYFGGGVAAERDGAHEESANWMGDKPPLDDAAHARLRVMRESYGNSRGKVEADRVCPRWVSPDSSRVVYGSSPYRRW
ncbi:hypothetical protein ABB37_08665 [Leptomonas pyrrhocoris]|uniref:Uncharacterized protein n=1 Tax=Leptomonas pyrrhocoris TaxID=157538 RepID=A0A0M9FT37_LEPPY|nr:hypothetical protein ABB37_08665 [Leptomonas pyrrhocoris]KPA75389.1 hypothetical protein ABB37_08665 [Leptomonas pyrrhocoris]|eukprot:XP_015653828.1 hypothetical protein ABB37_08665 [Leptomonas pyrrhocoris]